MKFSRLTQILCDTHNPLLMYRGCNPIPDKVKRTSGGRENPNLHFYKEFHRLYQEALKFTPSKNLVFSLEADFSDTNQGLGGFAEAGYVPTELFRDVIRKNDSAEEIQKDLRYYWPRCHQTGKYMKFLASINLNIWPKVLHDALCIKGNSQWSPPSSRAIGYDLAREDGRNIYESDIWMHLFVSEQSDFETFVPDCHVRLTTTHNYDKVDPSMAEWSRNYDAERELPKETLIPIIEAFQKENCVESPHICGPKQFFTNIRPRFNFDGLGKISDKLEELSDSDNPNDFGSWKGSGDCTIYGRPRSQQTEKRFISPDSYNGLRALTPMFSFSDAQNDITHQFYADAVCFDAIRHKYSYCKLDSSNT